MLGATKFSRNVILLTRSAETSIHRVIVLPKNNIADCHLIQSSCIRIIKLKKTNDPERNCSDSLFSRISFSRIVSNRMQKCSLLSPSKHSVSYSVTFSYFSRLRTRTAIDFNTTLCFWTQNHFQWYIILIQQHFP